MQNHISRRTFLSRTAVAGTALGIGGLADTRLFAAAPGVLPEPSAKKLPRWHGFNLLEKFNGQNHRFNETDFEWIAELGFNFVRLPMDYRMWIEDNDWTKFHEPTLKEIDEAVKFGETHGVHVNLNFHRAPGYTVAQPPEPKPVWSNDEALRVCALHWATFAKRYQGIPNRVLSFNLFNEPAKLEADTYRRVVAHIVEAIRKHDEKRLIICDGREWGNVAPTELLGLGVAAATRGYRPSHVSHYQASWVNGADKWSEPTWPIKEGDTLWNKETLRERQIEPWKKLEARGVGVMVGEFGAFNRTPHKIVLAWLRDCLDLWKQAGWGWAMWNFSGGFGILDSGRADVKYEDWHGHKLDREMLEMLQSFKG
ncbi:MAG TPA: cellulase family glycosylhydrolase [Candidatus Angelobacter sp.]|nr:cellulase family glycosylhydrolase [Candidatus Angelobacter sp.]